MKKILKMTLKENKVKKKTESFTKTNENPTEKNVVENKKQKSGIKKSRSIVTRIASLVYISIFATVILIALLVVPYVSKTLQSNTKSTMSDVVKTLGESFDKQIDRSGKNVVLTKVALRNALKGARIEGLSTSYMYIIDSDKNYAWHPDENKIGSKVDVPVIEGIVDKMLNKGGGSKNCGFVDYKYKGRNKTASYLTSNTGAFTLVLCCDKSEINAPVRKVYARSAIAIIIVVVIMGSLAIIIPKRFDPAADIPGCASGFSAGEAGERLQTAIAVARKSHLIIDAMTGIGIQGSLRGIPAALASALGLDGEAPDEPALPNRESSGDFPLVLAVDTPSGVGVNDGSLPGPYIPATVTVTFGAMKPCAVLPPATFACGRIELLDFGFDIDDKDPDVEVVDNSFASDAVRLPRFEDSKYSRGVVGLVTGSQRYPGAAVLTASAAARANTGMVRYLGPERAQNMVLAALPEAVIGKGHVQSWVVGSGVPEASVEGTDGDMQRDTIAALLKHYALGSEDENKDAYDMPPIVVDAGALDLLPERVPGQVVITPHAGEMAKLLNRFETAASTAEHADSHEPYTADDVRLNPLASAKRAHELTGATVLLKGAVTIVVDEDHVYASGSAPAWLGTAGAGDVLAGLTGALLAQQDDVATTGETVASAAYLHGLAAAIASESEQQGWQEPELIGREHRQRFMTLGHPIVAGDVAHAIPEAIADVIA